MTEGLQQNVVPQLWVQKHYIEKAKFALLICYFPLHLCPHAPLHGCSYAAPSFSNYLQLTMIVQLFHLFLSLQKHTINIVIYLNSHTIYCGVSGNSVAYTDKL